MTSKYFKQGRRSLCAEHLASVKKHSGWKRAFVVSLGLSVAGLTPLGLRDARANTADNVTGTAANTPLDSGSSYSGGLPGTSSDVTFTAGTGYAGTFTLNTAPLSIGTLDDLNTTALSISASQSITLNGGSNSVAASTSDLLYVASGGNLTLYGTGGLILASSNNFDIVGTASIGSNISGSQTLNKTGTGTLVLAGTNTFTGTTQSVNGNNVLVSTVMNAGTIQVQSNSALGTGYFKFENTGNAMSLQAGVNNLTIANNIIVNEYNGNLPEIDNNGYSSLTLSGNIFNNTSGTENGQNLGFMGSGTTYITSTASQFTGRTFFNGGTVNVASIANTGVASSLGTRGTSIDASTPGLAFQGGTLQYTGSTAQSTNRLIGLNNSGGTIDASGSTAAATLSFTQDFTTSGANLFINGGGRTLTLTGTNTGNNYFGMTLYDQASNGTNLIKNGTGTWVYAGNANGTVYTGTNATGANSGTITVNAGTLIVPGNNSARTGATTVASAGTLQLQANAANTSSGVSTALSGTSGSLAVNNGSTIQLRGDSSVSFSGTALTGFVGSAAYNFDVNQLTSAGTGNTLTLGAGGFATGGTNYVQNITLNVTGGNGYTLGFGSININSADNLVLNPTTANVTIAGLTNSTTNLTKNGAGTATIGNISTNQSGGNISVTGGTLILNGSYTSSTSSTLTGTVSVTGSGSQLLVNGADAHTGSVTAGSGATLGGAGSLAGAATINGTVAPGSAASTIGMLTLSSTGGATIAASGTYLADLNATTSDNLKLSGGALTITSGATLTFNTLSTPTAASYDLANYTSETGAFAVTNLPSGYTLQYGATELDLVATAVPEPSTWAAGLLCLGVIGFRLRRRVGLGFLA